MSEYFVLLNTTLQTRQQAIEYLWRVLMFVFC
nr:MAG TPA: hypothetical protein [Caudoviricetes sp.]